MASSQQAAIGSNGNTGLPACRSTSATPTGARSLLAVVMGAANVLLLQFVGRPYGQTWYVILGAVGVALAAACLASQVLQRDSAAQVLVNLLAVLTLCAFDIWAFSHLSNLMMFLGLYFFALFGLVLGAAIGRLVRVACGGARAAALGLSTLAVAGVWTGGLVLEASYFPADARLDYLKKIRRLPPGETVEQARQRIPLEARTWLLEHHPPGGALGYVKWALRSGEIRFNVPGRDRQITYALTQHGGWFAVRLVLSLFLLAASVGVMIRRRAPQST